MGSSVSVPPPERASPAEVHLARYLARKAQEEGGAKVKSTPPLTRSAVGMNGTMRPASKGKQKRAVAVDRANVPEQKMDKEGELSLVSEPCTDTTAHTQGGIRSTSLFVLGSITTAATANASSTDGYDGISCTQLGSPSSSGQNPLPRVQEAGAQEPSSPPHAPVVASYGDGTVIPTTMRLVRFGAQYP